MTSPADRSLPEDYFEDMYAASDDPWRIGAGFYEHRKRALVLAALPQQRFELTYEPGCGNGDLTVGLARRSDRLIAWDGVASAVRRTRDRCRELPGVDVRVGRLPAYWPDGDPDLVVFSEVGYYLSPADLRHAVDAIGDRLRPGGALLAVHWRHDAADYPLSGDAVHRLIGTEAGLERLAHYDDDDLVLDVWTSGPAVSVARRTGVL